MSDVPEPVRLIGNPEENFYILGKKHQAAFKSLYDLVRPPVTLRSQWEKLTERLRSSDPVVLPDNSWGRWLRAYCEGLDISPARYLEFLDLIEAGAIPQVLSGCTSIFRWDEATQAAQHIRLLDWPKSLTPHGTSELVLIEAPKHPKLLLVCVPGLLFLPLTAMNSNGVTLALHAKYHTLHHPEGRPVSEAVFEGMLNSKNCTELRRHLKGFQTKRLWGLHSVDDAGMVLVMDIGGPQVDVVNADLREARLMVFNNAPLAKNKELEQVEPAAFSHFCRVRREWALERLTKSTDESALVQLTRAHKLHRAQAPAVTLSTTQAMCFSIGARSLEWLVGDVPLWQQGKLAVFQDIFQSSMRKVESKNVSFNKEEKHEWQLRHHFARAQEAMDLSDITAAFHYIQMGLAEAQGEARVLGTWVWSWWQWKHLSGKRDRLMLYHDTQETLRRTSAPYREHVQLLRMLLEIELGLSATVTPMELTGGLRTWSEKYLLQTTSGRQALQKNIEARLDVQDLILPWTNTSQPR